MSLSLKVTYNNDTRKITSTPQDLYDSIADRFGLPSRAHMTLLFNEEPVTLEQIIMLAGATDKTTKLVLLYDHDHSDHSDSSSESDSVSSDEADDVIEAVHIEQPIVNVLVCTPDDPPPLYTPVDDAKVGADAEAKSPNKETKAAAKAAKRAANKAQAEAKAAAKAVKAAEKAAKKSEKVAPKLAAKAAKKEGKVNKKEGKPDKKEGKPDKNNKKEGKPDNPNTTMDGYLMNALGHKVAAEVTLLPCQRMCIHVESHPGNLRVAKGMIQKNGGRGPWAQFCASPVDDQPSMFRLESHKLPGSYLAVDHNGEFIATDELLPMTLWSFYPQDTFEPFMFEAPTPLPTAREVYGRIQTMITQVADAAGIDIRMGDAPDDEGELIGMLNRLVEVLPHGVQRIAIKKLGLREFEIEQPESIPEEWDVILEDLQEMGFSCVDENIKAVQASNGDLKGAIKVLVKASRQ
eukprot:TRINITY_DN1104_c0_g8_i1.p1 TRINITY_DN1104_c0_g8~~TRINITY_DN1104_c0_g8_i1.p1  ORF type:complete len:462 (-),score=178.98 TRINITY_DN1104_c0_g8_i1:240-1625(-)